MVENLKIVNFLPFTPMTPHEMYDHFDPEKNWFVQYMRDPWSFGPAQVSLLKGLPSRLDVMLRGGMPGTIELPLETLSFYFSSYVQTYVERDVRSIENIEDYTSFSLFIGLMAALTAQEINYTQLGRELGIAPKTAQKWLRILMQGYQWYELPAFHQNSIKRLSLKPKGHIVDTGIACYLQRITSPAALAVSPLQGALFESYCCGMIRAFCAALPVQPHLYHWRSHAGAEVDLVLELDEILYPIEIKATSSISGHDFRGLEAFRATYPHRKIAPGILLYGGQDSYRVSDNVIALSWNSK